MFKIIDGSICAPLGFLATGVHAGIRKNKDKPDLALIYSQTPAVAAGVFTTNLAKAAPVILTQKNIQNGQLQAIVVNSGNANACTGSLGVMHAKQMVETTAAELNIDPNLVAVSSTGIIGVTLPIDNVTQGIKTAVSKISFDSNTAAQAIMTTDTFAKSVAIELKIDEKKVCIGGIAKGSGMIHPNMATMLSFITTDISITHECLQFTLSKINESSFNMITVDGESSTNDMVLVLANGMAQNSLINSIHHPYWQSFYEGLSFVCTNLAKQIVQDGEGATKLIEVQVSESTTEEQARLVAKSVCKSSLVKTAIFGEDANWGRIVSAAGASGADIILDSMSVDIGHISLFKNGVPILFDEDAAREELKQKVIVIKIKLGQGTACATGWGCDLTYDYVKINAAYRT